MRNRSNVKLLAALTALTLTFPIQTFAGEWRQSGDKWKYILEDGREQRNSWLKTDDGKWYHFDENGMMTTGWYRDEDQSWYYLEADGSMASGWKQVAGKWYYLEPGGSMASGWKQINGKWYYLDKQSGEALVNGYTPDGYYVDGKGAWTGTSSRNDRDDSDSDTKADWNSSPVDNGNSQPGGGNGNSENSGTGGGNQNGGNQNGGNQNGGNQIEENPWENKSPVIMEQSGIISVLGLPYAVISFSGQTEEMETFRYFVAGEDATSSVTPVTASGRTIKIPLPDANIHTLAITSGKWTVSLIALRELGKSTVAEREAVESGFSIPSDLPYVVIAKATIPLTQYIKFIRDGDTLFIKPSITTVDDTLQAHSLNKMQSRDLEAEESRILVEEDNQSIFSLKAMASDAVASATAAPPASLEGKEETASIAVLFDLAANNIIADNLGIRTSSVEAFLSKWEPLEKLIALNEDLTLSTEAKDLKARSWKNASGLPRYVKYLTDKGGYGTKVELLTGKTDNAIPPELSISPSLRGTGAVIRLSEENESWYRSITEIEIPYNITKTHYYQENNTLSSDGKTITLGVDAISGPMNYAGTYEVTIRSFGFDDVKGTLYVVEQAPDFTPTWEDSKGWLKLKANFSYYADRIKTVAVNGNRLESGDFTADINSIYIPYRYLLNGKNTFEIQAEGYENASFEVESPAVFATPKRAPAVTAKEVIGGSSAIVFNMGDYPEGSEQMQWFQALEAVHLKLSNGYGTVAPLSLTKEKNSFTVTAESTSMSVYNSYTMQITVPGYDIVTVAFTPVNTAPDALQQWDMHNYSLKLTSPSDAFYLGSKVEKVLLNGKELKKGESLDYTASYSEGIEIFAHNFTAGESYKIELYGSSYAVKVLEGTVPESLTAPLEAPVLKTESVPKGSDVVVQALGEADGWLDKISSVTVASSPSSAGSAAAYERSTDGLIINSSDFYYSGVYTITVKADGYRTAQVEVKILNTADVTGKVNYDTGLLELTADYAAFYEKAAVFLNGTKLVNGEEYTVKGKILSVPAKLLTEENNRLVLDNEDYQRVEMDFKKYIAASPAPKLEVEKGNSMSGEKIIVLNVENEDPKWWDSLDSTCVSVKASSTNQKVSSLTKNSAEGSLTIELNSDLSYSSEYTITISVPGYVSCSDTFQPYQKVPEISWDWQEAGALKLVTDKNSYFSSSYIEVYLDEEKLAFDEDYSLDMYGSPASLTIFAENFTSGEYSVKIVRTGFSNYEPYEITVTVPEREITSASAEMNLIPEEPAAGGAENIGEADGEEISGDKISEEEASEDKVTEEGIPEDKVTEEGIPEDKVTEEDDPGDKISEEGIPEDKVTEEDIPGDKVTEEEISEDKVTEEEIPENKVTEEDVPGDKVPSGETPGEETEPVENSGKNKDVESLEGESSHESAVEDTEQEESIREDEEDDQNQLLKDEPERTGGEEEYDGLVK